MPGSNPRRRRLRRTLPVLGCALLLGALALVARAANPDALWNIVHGECVPAAAAGNPAPCAEVTADWAVLKDIVGATQFLLIPTERIAGIESPAILAPGAPNFFAAAWQARHFTEARAGHPLPRDAIALVINPPSARSQNQLHIHIDCIQPAIRDTLAGLPIGATWTKLATPLAGQIYAAIRLPGDALDRNPFLMLAQDLPGAREEMGRYTLVLIGRSGAEPGFTLLAGQVGPDGLGHGEDLEDHSCALAADASPG